MFLIEKKIPQNPTPEGNYPIHEAAKSKSYDVLRLLLDNGADPNCVNKKGNSALHLAASGGVVEICTLLLEYGSSPDLSNNKGSTPLHIASKFGYYEISRLMIEFEADIFITDFEGYTAMNIAFLKGHNGLINLYSSLGLDNDNLDLDNPDTRKHERNPRWGFRGKKNSEDVDELN